MSSDSDTELTLRVKASDMAAFNTLVARFRRPLIGFFFRLVQDQALAEELALEAFLRLYRSRHAYAARSKFSSWLYGIATNLASDYLRDIRQKRAKPKVSVDGREEATGLGVGVADPSPSAEQALLQRERVVAIRQHVDALPERQRIALMLHKYQGLNYQEIAEVLGLSESEAKFLLFHAYETLRERLKEFFYEHREWQVESGSGRTGTPEVEGQMKIGLARHKIGLVDAKALYTRWGAMVLRSCRLFLGENGLTEQATVETFARFLREGHRAETNGVPVALLRITYLKVSEHPARADESPEPLRAAIVQLDTLPRAMFILHGAMALQMPWVAAILNITSASAKQLWAQTLIEIRGRLPQDFFKERGR